MKRKNTQKIKICHIADLNQIHCQRYIGYFIERNDQDINILNCYPAKIGYVSFEEYGFDTKNYNIFNIYSEKPHKVLSKLILFINLVRSIRKMKPDIVHVHGAGILAFLTMLAGAKNVIVFPWGSDLLVAPQRSFWQNLMVRFILKKATKITPTSEVVAEACYRLGVGKGKTEIIQLGIDLAMFSQNKPIEELKIQLGIEAGDPVILSVRNFRPEYNIETIVKSIPKVLEKAPNTKFVFLRRPVETQEKMLLQLIQRLGVADAIRYVGVVNHQDMPLYYNLADILVSVPLTDSSPNSLHEAMACDAVPIASNIPANRYWIKDGCNGYLVEPMDSEQLATKIINLVSNKNIMTSMAVLNRKIAEEKLDKEYWLDRLDQIYTNMVHGND